MSTETAKRLLKQGWLLQQEDNLTGAVQQYEAVLREPTEELAIPMTACVNIGNIALNRCDYEGAIKWYRQGADIDPSSDAPYFNLAGVFRDMQRYSDAITAYKMAIDRNDRDPDCRHNLASVYLTVGKDTLAAAELAREIDLRPEADPNAYLNLGGLYYKTRNELGAVIWLDRFMGSSEEIVGRVGFGQLAK